jgi:diacylglycerol kinase family enzyme
MTIIHTIAAYALAFAATIAGVNATSCARRLARRSAAVVPGGGDGTTRPASAAGEHGVQRHPTR